MAENTIDIEVQLTGADKAKKNLTSIGETAGQMAENFDSENSKLGEGLGGLSDSVGELGSSFGELGTTIGSLGQKGSPGLLALVPAIGGVVMAGMALWETFKMITGAAQEAEDAEEAMAAAASDLQSKLEMLSEKGVVLSVKELDKFTDATIEAQFAKEMLQKRMERIHKPMTKQLEATRDLKKAQEEQADALKKGRSGYLDYIDALNDEASAKSRILELDKKKKKAMEVFRADQVELNRMIREAAKLEKKAEEKAPEAILAKVKELNAKREALELLKSEIGAHDEYAQKRDEIEIKAKKARMDERIEREKDNDKQIHYLHTVLDSEVRGLEMLGLIDKKARHDRRKLDEETHEKWVEQQRARAVARQAEQTKALMLERQRLIMTHQLQTEALMGTNATALELLELRYQQQRQMAGDNAQSLLLIDMRYEREKSGIIRAEEDKRRAEINAQELHRRQFILESQEFDLSMMEDGTEKELSLLELKYRKERELKEHSEQELTELTRRYNIERAAIEEQSVNAQIERVGELTNSFGAGFAEAAYAAAFAGESFTEAIGDVIGGLGKQAAVEALMQTAKGLAALVLNPKAAAGHFAAAAAFGVAAGAAGGVSAAMSGGGGGGGGGAVSPTGSPQIAPDLDRERAETGTTVFNVNFGGAVIYDTRRAAEEAMVDRFVSLMNTPRRGARRLQRRG